jgi:hypothetical protein
VLPAAIVHGTCRLDFELRLVSPIVGALVLQPDTQADTQAVAAGKVQNGRQWNEGRLALRAGRQGKACEAGHQGQSKELAKAVHDDECSRIDRLRFDSTPDSRSPAAVNEEISDCSVPAR